MRLQAPSLFSTEVTLATTATTTAATQPVRGLAARLGALSQPKYRRFWLGSLAAVGGTQLVQVAIGWLIVKELGGAGTALGVVGAATAIPTILVNLFGGVLADRLDRKRILIVTSALSALLLAALAALDASGAVRLWHVIAISVGTGLVFGFDWPTRNAFFPMLISREHMASAVTFNSILWQGTRVVAPAIGGGIIAISGTEVVLFVAAGGMAAMTLVLLTLSVPPSPPKPQRDVMKELGDGVLYIWRTPMFRVLVPLTYANMFFGMQYIPLMPLFADRFGVGPEQFGYMLSMLGIGAVTGTVVASRLQGGRWLGTAMLGGTITFTLFLMAFAWSPAYGVTLPLIFCAALFNSVFMINSMTAMQLTVPDSMRGRVMGMHGITFSLISVGGLLGGTVADSTSEQWAIFASALVLTAIVSYVALTQRHVRDLDGARLREARQA